MDNVYFAFVFGQRSSACGQKSVLYFFLHLSLDVTVQEIIFVHTRTSLTFQVHTTFILMEQTSACYHMASSVLTACYIC